MKIKGEKKPTIGLDSILLGSQALLISRQMFHSQVIIRRLTTSHLAVSLQEHRDLVLFPCVSAKSLAHSGVQQ